MLIGKKQGTYHSLELQIAVIDWVFKSLIYCVTDLQAATPPSETIMRMFSTVSVAKEGSRDKHV